LIQQLTPFEMTHQYSNRKRKSNREWATYQCSDVPLATSYCS
jgi:hypothetical protein